MPTIHISVSESSGHVISYHHVLCVPILKTFYYYELFHASISNTQALPVKTLHSPEVDSQSQHKKRFNKVGQTNDQFFFIVSQCSDVPLLISSSYNVVVV